MGTRIVFWTVCPLLFSIFNIRKDHITILNKIIQKPEINSKGNCEVCNATTVSLHLYFCDISDDFYGDKNFDQIYTNDAGIASCSVVAIMTSLCDLVKASFILFAQNSRASII